jgi:hypothetical protein
MTWTPDVIKGILAAPSGKTGRVENRRIIYRMLQRMYERQTYDEQCDHTTKHSNGMGFNYMDADVLSDIAQRSQQYGNLTIGQAQLVANKLRKYVMQLHDIACQTLMDRTERSDIEQTKGATK